MKPKYVLAIICSALAGTLLFAVNANSAEVPKKIVLIGGPKSHGVGEHDFPVGIAVLEKLLRATPGVEGMTVVAYPNGWPLDASDLDGATTVVLYFDGVQNGDGSHPLFNNAHRAEFERLMKKGVGVVALHQASTVDVTDTTINLPRWLGGARYGMFDHTTESIAFKPETLSHPVSNGVSAFLLTDEFYP